MVARSSRQQRAGGRCYCPCWVAGYCRLYHKGASHTFRAIGCCKSLSSIHANLRNQTYDVFHFQKNKTSLMSVSDREDSSRIFVAIGYGFFVEMTHDEALRFIEKKTNQLTASVHHLSCEIPSNTKWNVWFLVFMTFYFCRSFHFITVKLSLNKSKEIKDHVTEYLR